MENILLILALMICVITDIKSRKILNMVTLPTILMGFIYYIYTSGQDGFLYSGKGLLVGLVLLLIPFMMGGIGAGDVKLLAAIGAVKGAVFVFHTFLFGAVIGGIIAFVMIKRRNGLISFFKRLFYSLFLFKVNKGSLNLSNTDLAPTIPYGVAIALGVLCTYLLGGII